MNMLGVWSLLAILYQTILCIIISWLTLSCKLSPEASELAEVTLVKLLYLYDPEACGRIHFYNYTRDTVGGEGTAVVWPVRNNIAAGFRSKMQIWLGLHLTWAGLGVVTTSQGIRPCGYYVTLLPFTLTGVAILVVDVVFCAFFLVDATKTETEPDILEYINSNKDYMHSINSTLGQQTDTEDTSWIAVMFAYYSIRGVVQWIINFWIVKDSYYSGLAVYHNLQQMNGRRSSRGKSVQLRRIAV